MPDETRLTGLGKFSIFLFICLCIGGTYFLFKINSQKSLSQPSQDKASKPLWGDAPVEIGIAYGTEKEKWLKWATEEFKKTPQGENIKINLIPKGSLEGAQLILAQDTRVTVWSPASSIYKDVFLQEWRIKFSGDPFYREETLALSPMVFVFWKERYDAFAKKFSSVDFKSIQLALSEITGWKGISGKPEWGLFKFGHTHPNQSNSGLVTLVLAAYHYHQKTQNLEMKDILDADFQNWIAVLEQAVSSLSNSTGTLMREMVLKGPSSYDAVFVYENVAIDYLKNAEGRWGELRIVYPKENIWNDNPYYIINAPWVTKKQQDASVKFLEFLMSESIQKEALTHGFRPGNLSVPIKTPESPFSLYTKYGIQVDVGTVCEPPQAEITNNLLASWQRYRGSR